MSNIKSIIKDTIFYEISWISGDDEKECSLYLTLKRFYFSNGSKKAVFRSSNVERISYFQNSGGNYIVQIYMAGNSYQVFNFPGTDEGKAMAERVFEAITNRIQ